MTPRMFILALAAKNLILAAVFAAMGDPGFSLFLIVAAVFELSLAALMRPVSIR